ncbi:MAG: hypothetical protein LBH76_05085, partial [Propionibacteriaceae bacterium]|nr:hypothetical protein [Propionibacteriaceae bacterium]
EVPVPPARGVVNTAQAKGQPSDNAGRPLETSPGNPLAPVLSPEDQAAVRTQLPVPSVSIEKYDTAGGPVEGDRDDAPGKTLAPGATTAITIEVSNDGEDELVDITVSEAAWTGPGSAGDFGLTCDFSPRGPASGTTWAGPFLPGERFLCSGTVPVLAAGQNHSDTIEVEATGRWSGRPVEDQDPWHGRVFDPSVALAKWVCAAGSGCSTPTGAVLAALAGGQPDGGWVKQTTVGYRSAAQWLLVITNTGDTRLADVTLVREDRLAGGGGYGVTSPECAQNTNLGSLDAGESTTVTCTTANITNVAPLGANQAVVNTAVAAGAPVDAAGNRIAVDGGTLPNVQSAPDQAEANTVIPRTAVDIEKYDTLDGDDAITGDHDSPPGRALVAGEETPITIVITNTGEEALTDIDVADTEWEGPGSPADFGLDCDFSPLGGPATGTSWNGQLAVGASFECQGTVPGLTAGETHFDAVAVAAAGVLTGTPVEDEDGWHGYAPNPALSLVKWVCQAGTGCLVPTGTALTALAAGQPAAGWVKQTTVAYGTDAQWLLVLSNTGDTNLVDVTLTREDLDAGGGGHGSTGPGCAVNTTVAAALPPGRAAAVSCATARITNGAAWGSGEDVVNTAQAEGQPADAAGVPLSVGAVTWPTVESPESAAEVNTIIPIPDIVIEKYDTLDGDDAVTGDHDAPPGKPVAPGVPTPLTIQVQNTGDEALVNVEVVDVRWTGPGSAEAFGLACNFSPWGGPPAATSWAGPLPAGATVTCFGTVPGLPAGTDHSDTVAVTAAGALTGQPVGDDDDWNGYAPNPRLALTKWVCAAEAGCAAPTAPELAELAADQPAGGWAKQATVKYRDPAEWLLVLDNTGDTNLVNVTLVREDLAAGGGGHGATTGDCVVGVDLGRLAPGERTTVRCATADITNDAPWGSRQDVVNTARAAGQPADTAWAPLSVGGAPMGLALSAESAAEANTVRPVPDIDIEKYDTLDGPSAPLGDFDLPPGRLLLADTPTPITMTIRNTGDEDLVDVTVEDVIWYGPAIAGSIGLSCDFSTAGGPSSGTQWSGPFRVGDEFSCSGTIPGLPLGAGHTDTATVRARGAWTADPVGDDDDWNGHVPDPRLALTKWVCSEPAGCPAPADADLAELAAGRPAAGWVKRAVVPLYSEADWLLVLTNTGDSNLVDVTLTREDLAAGGGGHGATSSECAVGRNLGSLAPGASVTVTCSTADIVNVAPFGSGEDVVNTAAAAGVPVNVDGIALQDLHPGIPGVVTAEDSAEARTDVGPAPQIDVEKFDTLDGDDAVSGDFDTAPGKLLGIGMAAPVTVLVRNAGNEDLIDVVVADVEWEGPDSPAAFGLSCDFSALGGPSSGTQWAGPFLVGDEFSCAGTVPGLGAGDFHMDTVAATATGLLSGQEVVDEDSWHAYTPNPELELVKWVCAGGVGCAVPTGPDLTALAAGVPAAGWVKQTTVEYGGTAQWLLTLWNTGDTALADVTLVREDLLAGGGGHGATSGECAHGRNLGLLQSAGRMALTCETDGIVNVAALGSGLDVVNTAQAAGRPADSSGTPIMVGSTVWPAVVSNESAAEANTLPSSPDIDIDKRDTLGGSDEAAAADVEPGRPLLPGRPTPITVTVRNTGDEDLVDVAIEDVVWRGPAGATGSIGLSCDFSALGGPSSGVQWPGPFLVGDEFTCLGTVPPLEAGDVHADTATVRAEGRWSGRPVGDDDDWHGHVPDPQLTLTKWVCTDYRFGCPIPTGADLAALAGGHPTAHWIKRTVVALNASAEWLLVLTNTGDTNLVDVTLTREDLDAGGGGHGATSSECVVGRNLGALAPGEALTVRCATADIVNVAPFGSGEDV